MSNAPIFLLSPRHSSLSSKFLLQFLPALKKINSIPFDSHSTNFFHSKLSNSHEIPNQKLIGNFLLIFKLLLIFYSKLLNIGIKFLYTIISNDFFKLYAIFILFNLYNHTYAY